jgi:methylglutaconyl-CoA hydratase
MRRELMAGSFRTIIVEESDQIHTITLNRPERRNALNPEMIRELSQALDAAERCPCGVVILTGAGSAFCSGMDLDHLRSLNNERPEDQRADAESFVWLMRRLYEFTKPTIAAVNGPALAGGAGLAMQCDFTLAVASAKFGFPEAKIGFIPAAVSVFLIPIVGEKRARDLLLSGRLLPAAEAAAWGLVTVVLPDGELTLGARARATVLMKNSPVSMREMKRLLANFSKVRLDADLRRAIRWSERVRNDEDFREGMKAFLEKREPVWPSRSQR